MGKLHVWVQTSDPTIRFAEQEFIRIANEMAEDCHIVSAADAGGEAADSKTIRIGLLDEAGLLRFNGIKDHHMDDAIAVDVQAGHGSISGSNPRAVLLAVYRFFYELGCRWVRPGADGEIIPARRLSDMSAHVSEMASLRHRGVVIEGASSYEHVRDMIDWLPKLGYNSYFIQFKDAFPFFHQWYAHINNPTIEPQPFTIDDAKSLTRRLEQEIAKRCLLYHAVGHGWTCESLGVPALGAEDAACVLDPAYENYLAEIGGKRAFWSGNPSYTNLCYSKPEVRALMVDHMIEHLEQNPVIDMLHVWLADDFNNHCECGECAKRSPTDWYVRLINELDERLSAKGNRTKIVFLLYFELLWAPQTETISNPDRFLLMFAPISRTFAKSFAEMGALGPIPPYVRNQIKLPQDVTENAAFLKEWQRHFAGEGFDFDYPLGRAHYGDPGYMAISEIISSDIKSLKQLGLNGYMSCQEMRAFMPTGLPNYVMGLTLWNSELPYADIAEDYARHAFGPDWSPCMDYLNRLSSLFDIEYWCGQKQWIDRELAERIDGVQALVNGFKPVIVRNGMAESPVWRKSWAYLAWHADYCILFANVMKAKALGDNDAANREWDTLVAFLQQSERSIHAAFDVFRFIQIGQWKMQLRSSRIHRA